MSSPPAIPTIALLLLSACGTASAPVDPALAGLEVSLQPGDPAGLQLAISYQHPLMLRRLEGIEVTATARCQVAGQVVTDHGLSLAPMLIDPRLPKLTRTTDTAEVTLFQVPTLTARPDACEVVVTSRDPRGESTVLVEACAPRGAAMSPGRCSW